MVYLRSKIEKQEKKYFNYLEDMEFLRLCGGMDII